MSNEFVEVPDEQINKCKINFSGDKVDRDTCKIKIGKLFEALEHDGTLEIGNLVELVCETPLEKKCDAFDLIKSRKAPVVIAGGINKGFTSTSLKAKYVLVVSSDKVKRADGEAGKSTQALHRAFHGVERDVFKAIDIKETDWLVFFGNLQYIVYKVPNYSERRGTPFIHEARDRGEGIKKSKKKPIVCVSPNRDFLVMYGSEFEFTKRGIIG